MTGQKRNVPAIIGPPHMHVEAQIFLPLGAIIEIQTAIPEVQVQPRVGVIIDCADNLPVDMGAHPETAEVTVGGQAEAVAKGRDDNAC